jgi:hypothetical protein
MGSNLNINPTMTIKTIKIMNGLNDLTGYRTIISRMANPMYTQSRLDIFMI